MRIICRARFLGPLFRGSLKTALSGSQENLRGRFESGGLQEPCHAKLQFEFSSSWPSLRFTLRSSLCNLVPHDSHLRDIKLRKTDIVKGT